MSDRNIHAAAKESWFHSFWSFVHTISLYPITYYENDDRKIINTFYSLEVCIPCPTCKEHYRMFCESHDIKYYIEQDIRYGLFRWTVDLHNYVNKQMNKQEISFEDALSVWAYYK